ncbi:hypothetical protein [Flexilinea flocculi]|jgi:uncharacterized membrane protein YdbT with pleckstrin-like domain|uniref:Uncharacterized protein n=1 Tax=Flexilinea flocculi TaxID=1678840 RepID=A0A0K8P9X6_9CHLR|nr:hypothetical protein [Flexilinea flocculi]NMB92871.1 hypothetical protein [Flexilinea flocculi]GAP39468.1 hypothetical protein ATC1_11403 [Flexilinea flocculi]
METIVPTEIHLPVSNPAAVNSLELGLVILFSILVTILIFFVVKIIIDFRRFRYH